MFNNSLTSSLKSLNEINARPKRTSYGEMSTWFFMDSKEKTSEFDKSYLNFNEFNPVDFNQSSNLNFPIIANNQNKTEKLRLPSAREITNTPVIREYLMKNWAERRTETNKRYSGVIKDGRKGRSGAGGVWPNITQAFREDGNRFLFIQEPTYNRDPLRSNRRSHTPIRIESPKIYHAIFEKQDRERLGVQTRHGVEHANWNVLR